MWMPSMLKEFVSGFFLYNYRELVCHSYFCFLGISADRQKGARMNQLCIRAISVYVSGKTFHRSLQ
jgi:hypothetical protein